MSVAHQVLVEFLGGNPRRSLSEKMSALAIEVEELIGGLVSQEEMQQQMTIFNKRLMDKYHRNVRSLARVLINCKDWCQRVLEFDLVKETKGEGGRPRKPFVALCPSSKRRRTFPLRNAASHDELFSAVKRDNGD